MKNKKSLQNDKGSSIIIFVICLTTMLGFAALVVDIGNVALQKAKTQSAVDAIALAAAQDLPDTVKATETAMHYAELNDISPSDIQVTFANYDNSIRIQASEHVDYFFAKIFNQQGTSIISKAGASKSLIGDAFDYVLFSGSTSVPLTLNSSSADIEGSIHSNCSFTVNGSHLLITGAAEAASTMTTNGNWISIGERIEHASQIDMPDFSTVIKEQAQQAGATYSGDKTYYSSNINVDSNIFVDGALTINGCRFTGDGCILVKNDVTFNGSNLNMTGEDAVCIYSQNGNITVNGNGATIDGIIYAPNGSVTFNGSNQTINGRVIAKTITFNGSGLNVVGGVNEVNSLPSYATKLEL